MNLLKKIMSHQSPKQTTDAPKPSNSPQAYSTQSPAGGPYSQPQIYVLPYPMPPPPYQGSGYQQYSTQMEQPTQRYNQDDRIPVSAGNLFNLHSSSRPSNEESSTQQGQYNQQNQETHFNSQNSSQSRHNSAQQEQFRSLHSAQPGLHPQYYSGQSNAHYSQQYPSAPPPPNSQYVFQYPVHPPSAQDASRIRPGRRRDQEDEEIEGWTAFGDQKVRAKFIRKVYTIVMLQLLFTLGIICLFVFEPNVKQFVQKNIFLYYISLAIFIVVYIGLACYKNMRRKYPANIIALMIFTMALSYMMGTISSIHNTEAVLMSVGICAAVSFVVSVFSFYTKFDFTSCGGILCILLLILFLFGIITIFMHNKVMVMIYAAAGAIVFTLMLAYDTQMMMGGKRHELSPEEYVFAALQIYLDIVYIFIFLLMLTGQTDS